MYRSDAAGPATRARRRLGATAASIAVVAGALTVVSGSAGAASGGLGPKNPATGTPVTVGMITESGSEAIGAQSKTVEQGAGVAVKYINQYLKGLAGHPIKLFICGNKGTPAGGTDCANQMVDKGVVAVVLPYTGQGPAEVPIVTGAGIPWIGLAGASQAELSTPGAFALTGGFPVTLAAQAQDAKDKGYKKFSEITIDVPSATQAAQILGGIVYKNAGVDYDVVTAAPGAPDMTPQLQSAVDSGADAIGFVGDKTFCTSFLQAYQTLALKTPRYVISTCIDPTIIKSLGDVLKGSRMTTQVTTDPKDPDFRTYAAAVKKFANGAFSPNPTKSTNQAGGFSSVMGLVDGMKGFTGDPTPAAIMQQFKTVQDARIFLSGGLTFTCDGKAVPLIPSICSAQIRLGTLDAKGNVRNSKALDVANLFAS